MNTNDIRINLPASKSMSNRWMVINHITGSRFRILTLFQRFSRFIRLDSGIISLFIGRLCLLCAAIQQDVEFFPGHTILMDLFGNIILHRFVGCIGFHCSRKHQWPLFKVCMNVFAGLHHSERFTVST